MDFLKNAAIHDGQSASLGLILPILIMSAFARCAEQPISSEKRSGIREIGKAKILDARDGLPETAAVLQIPVDDKTGLGMGEQKFKIGIAPAGFQPAWLDEQTMDDPKQPNIRSGLTSCFDGEACDFSVGTSLRWLSSWPATLLATGETFTRGSGNYVSRFDFLILYQDSAPKILLSEELLISGHAGHGHQYSGTRKVTSEVRDGIILLTFRDREYRSEDEEQPKALRRRKGSLFSEEENDGGFYGEISTERTRTWRVEKWQAVLAKDELKYKVQTGDSWQDIAEFFLQNKQHANLVRLSNGNTGDSLGAKEGDWITVPPCVFSR